MIIDLDDPIHPEDYEYLEEMYRSERITWGAFKTLLWDNPDFADWFNLRAMERNLADA